MLKHPLLTALTLMTFHADLVNANEFSQPWESPSAAIILDPYEKNKINWDELQKDRKVVAIIHKATEGLRVDKEYQARMAEAKKRGYLWGSYHLGRPGNPIEQAEKYLSVIDASDSDLIALDLEEISSNFMNLKDANEFIEYIAKKTNRIPILYTNHSTTKKIISESSKDSIILKSPLWYARFRREIPDFPIGGWKTYTIWQFSSEINCTTNVSCLYRVPGTAMDMDVNVFNGTITTLKEKWPLTPPFNP